MYFLKVGQQYVAENGTLVDVQAEAGRFDLPRGSAVRAVRAVPHGTFAARLRATTPAHVDQASGLDDSLADLHRFDSDRG